MLFCSEQFFVFFIIVFVVYWAMPWHRARVWLLLGASLYFYASWNKWLAAIIGVSTVLDYLLGRGMEAIASPRWRKLLLATSLVANLGLLFYFKYANFFLGSVEHALTALGRTSSLPVLKVILPVGISFYTFEAINYTVDVFKRRVPAERNLFHFMLFITFFPHLVAGPIVRARDFLPQIGRRKHWDWRRIHLGAQFFLMGLFKKLAIADRMALYADPVFASPRLYNTGAVWLAMLAYAIQIYCDFSGYSDMALGTAHMFGYKLVQNFNMPYLSVNISEIWQRWHISLSTWLRDYVFFPLVRSGRRKGKAASQRWRNNFYIVLTMTVCGLWHGANWTFIVWGVAHGLLQVGHRFFRDFSERRPHLDRLLQTNVGTAARILLTFLTWCFTLVVFRSLTFGAAASVFRRLLVHHRGLPSPLDSTSLWFTIVVMVICHAAVQTGVWKRQAVRVPAPLLGFGYALVFTLALVLATDTGKAFIYFQF